MEAVSENLLRKLDEIDAQHASIAAQLLAPDVLTDHRLVRSLSIRKAALDDLVADYREWRLLRQQSEEWKSAISANDDHELADLAREELPRLEAKASALITEVQRRLVTSEDQSVGSVILEVRAGVGGDEAAIWAGDLVQMYQQFATARGWRMEELQVSPGEHGGFKHAVFNVTGHGAWASLGYEGGTHQVKRVPATEAQGRIHTSTATVAVLPEPEEIEVKLAADEVKEIITTAQGPGGQNVNKLATAVHLIHLPTGIEVRMQETRSQGQNREKAWKLLRARLFERQQAEAHALRAEARNQMIGSGDRAEKIRTYRYKENIVVDHRVNQSFNLSTTMAGDLQLMIDQLVQMDVARRLAAL